jgi:hypothetical protein
MKTKTGVQNRKEKRPRSPEKKGKSVVGKVFFEAEQLDLFLPRGIESPILTWIEGKLKYYR